LQNIAMFDAMPASEQRCEHQPRVIAKMAKKDRRREKNPDVPDKMHPFQIQGPEDAPRVRALLTEHVNLDHLRDMLQKMPALRHQKDVEERKPVVPPVVPRDGEGKRWNPGHQS